MQLDIKKLVFVLLLFFYCKSSIFSQSFKIVEKTLNNKLTFDSLRSIDGNCLITIFYKDGSLKNDCNKSTIINSSDQKCNLKKFKEKLVKELNNCSFPEETTIQFYIYPKETIYYLKDENNKKTYIENIMAFVSNYGNELYTAPELSNFLNELNKKSKQHFIPTKNIFNTNSVFEFSSEIHKKSVNPSFKCPSDIHVLNLLKKYLIAGNSCPTNRYIPLEDIFIKHLLLLFKPNLVLNKQISYYKKKNLELEKEKDSLNKSYRIKLASIKKLWSESSLELNGQLGIVNSNSVVSDLENLNSKVTLFNSLDLSFNKSINEKIAMHISAELFNMQGDFELNSTEDSWNDDIGAENSLERTTTISGLKESWIMNNGVAAKIGISYVLTSFNDRLFIRAGGEIGKVFPFFISSMLDEGEFNYRAEIDNIDGPLTNITSLGLYDGVSYSSLPLQKNQFSGFVIGLNTTVTYSLTKKLYSKLFIDYSILQLTNQDYNPDSKISRNYGEFSSSMYQIKSLRISPLTIGFGIGLKF